MAKRPATSNKSTEHKEQRSENSLLSPSSIKRLREEKGESQNRFAQTLGIPQNSLSRYEQDILLQTKATDNFLRIIEKFPETYDFLSELYSSKFSSIKNLSELFPIKAKVEEGTSMPEDPFSYLFASATNGVGQTQTMVNVAFNFAEQGHPICMIEFPKKNNRGLEQFPLLSLTKTRRSKGIVDYFNQYQEAIERNDKGLLPQIEDYLILVNPQHDYEQQLKEIYWIPASSNDSREKGNNVNWNSLFNGPYGHDIMNELKWAIKRHTEVDHVFIDGAWKDDLALDFFKNFCNEIVFLYRDYEKDTSGVPGFLHSSFHVLGRFSLLVPVLMDDTMPIRKDKVVRTESFVSEAVNMSDSMSELHFIQDGMGFHDLRIMSNDLHYEPKPRPIIYNLEESLAPKLKQDYQELSQFLMSKDLNSDGGIIVNLKNIKSDFDNASGIFGLPDSGYGILLESAVQFLDNLEINRLLRDIYYRLSETNGLSFNDEPIGGISDTDKKSFIHALLAYNLAAEKKDEQEVTDAVELIKILLRGNYNKIDLESTPSYRLWSQIYNNKIPPDEVRAWQDEPFKYVYEASKTFFYYCSSDYSNRVPNRIFNYFFFANFIIEAEEDDDIDLILNLKETFIKDEKLAKRLSEIYNIGSDYKKLYVKDFGFDEVFFEHKDQLREYFNECLTISQKLEIIDRRWNGFLEDEIATDDYWERQRRLSPRTAHSHFFPDIKLVAPTEFASDLKTIASNSLIGLSEANEVFDRIQSYSADDYRYRNAPSSELFDDLYKLRKKFNSNPENLSPSIFLFDAAMARMTDWYNLDYFDFTDLKSKSFDRIKLSESVQDHYLRDWKDYFLVQSEKYMNKINSLPDKKCFSFITYDFINQNEFSEQLERLLEDVK